MNYFIGDKSVQVSTNWFTGIAWMKQMCLKLMPFDLKFLYAYPQYYQPIKRDITKSCRQSMSSILETCSKASQNKVQCLLLTAQDLVPILLIMLDCFIIS